MDEISTIKKYKTSNYAQFVHLSDNRDVKEKRVGKIMESMKIHGFLPSQPLIVTPNLEIIDGQGRLEAARRLGYPVYYEIETGDASALILAINISQSNWDIIDYVDKHAKKGISPYVELLDFEKKYKIGMTNAIVILFKDDSGSIYKRIRKGTHFQLNPLADAVMETLHQAKVYLPFWSTKKFVYAVSRTHTKANDRQIAKLRRKLSIVKEQTSPNNYLLMFENLINMNTKEGSERIILVR